MTAENRASLPRQGSVQDWLECLDAGRRPEGVSDSQAESQLRSLRALSLIGADGALTDFARRLVEKEALGA